MGFFIQFLMIFFSSVFVLFNFSSCVSSEAKGGNSFIYIVYFYSKFLQELEDCHDAPAKVGQCFTNRVSVSCQSISFLKKC